MYFIYFQLTFYSERIIIYVLNKIDDQCLKLYNYVIFLFYLLDGIYT